MLDDLRRNFRYDPDTGHLWWLRRRRGCSSNRPAGSLHSHGYWKVQFDGKFYYAHRIAWALHHGVWPHNEIDHINGNKLDNRIENLRVVTTGENTRAYHRSQAHA